MQHALHCIAPPPWPWEWSYQVEAAHEEQRVSGVEWQASSSGAVELNASEGGEPVSLSLHTRERGREGGKGGGAGRTGMGEKADEEGCRG